jgi:hypothetical protein
MKQRTPEEVVRMMEKPLVVTDESARAESAARLEHWAAQLARVAPAPAAAVSAPEEEDGSSAGREDRKRAADTLLERLDALNARPSMFDEDSLSLIFVMVLEERSLRRKQGK